MINRIVNSYFLILFSIIPVSIIFGPAVSLINILLIDLSFVALIFYKKEYNFLSNKTVKLIIFFCLYLIFNSITSKDFSMSALRNFGFIRFGVLFLAFNYFFYNKSFINKVLIIWALTLFVLTFDTYIESIFGTNIFGYGGGEFGSRIVSFFKDEPIVGGFLNGFYLIIIGYFFFIDNKFLKKYKDIILILSIFFLLAIFLTGERSSAIKASIGFILFYFICNKFSIKQKLTYLILGLIFIVTLLLNSEFLKHRYIGQIFNVQKDQGPKENVINYYEQNIYFKLYRSGFNVFQNYPLFGVGNKNYRVVACASQNNPKYVCNTHPHQIYIEFLAEHGLIGTMIIFTILFNLIFSKIKVIIASKNYLQVGSLIFLFTSFIPLLPSGAFFSDYSLTIFWVNLSIMYAVGKKTNVYS